MEPVKTIRKSGGTAMLVLLQPIKNLKVNECPNVTYVGKDMTHSKLEVQFYENRKHVIDRKEPGWALFNFMLKYEGIFRLSTQVTETRNTKRNYIVLENLLDGMVLPRLVDIKLGAFTADRHWNGKSRCAAWRNRQIDKVTNSEIEGYRMEGMEHPPESLVSLTSNVPKWTRVRRLIYQRHTAHDFLTYFFDMQHLSISSDSTDIVHSIELANSLHISLIEQLCCIMWNIQDVPVPQKWIGSSLVACYDSSCSRKLDESSSIMQLKVKLLDWGRSELISEKNWNKLSPACRVDRTKFWKLYTDSILRFLYETSRLYYLLYCASDPLCNEIRIEVFDRDMLNQDDFIGYVILPPLSVGYTEYPLLDRKGVFVCDESGQRSCIRLSIGQVCIPERQRHSYTRLHLTSAKNLPRMDVLGKRGCDPYAVVINPVGAPLGRTIVCYDTRNPVWNSWISLSNFDKSYELTRLADAFTRSAPSAAEPVILTTDICRSLFDAENSKGNQLNASIDFLRQTFARNFVQTNRSEM